jgi:para-aminobenzoate synthetase/4-amino-4-deoxychorismate lyase
MGVFETMLVIAGRPVELDAHLERLEASLATLYGGELPGSARDTILDEARGLVHGKLRIAVAPSWVDLVAHSATKSTQRGGRRPTLSVDAEEIESAAIFPCLERGISLHSTTVPGGLGEHKWADRRLLERAESTLSPRELPLLLDADGSVLEASRASVFCIGGDSVATPPTDGRILPSIARRQAIEAARDAGIEVQERALTLDDLRDGEAFLTGSVRGVEPVIALDGVALSPPRRISARVAAGLRRRWRVGPGEPVAAAAGGRPAGLREH